MEVLSREECSSRAAFLDGIPIPRLPSLAGRENNVYSRLLGGDLAIRAGRRVECTASSSSFSKGPLMQLKYIHLLINPCMRAEKAAWGWVTAIFARYCTLDIHSLTFEPTWPVILLGANACSKIGSAIRCHMQPCAGEN